MKPNEDKIMPVTLSIKNVPDDLAKELRERAVRHHRSIQGELMSILETTVRQNNRLTVQELLNRVRSYNVATPGEVVSMIRSDRDSR